MTDGRVPASLLGGIALLERAIGYTLGSLILVTPADMSRPTPCAAWDLRALLAHMNDSLQALCEAVEGHVDLDTPEDLDPVRDPIAALKSRACHLLGGWTNADRELVSVADTVTSSGVVTSAGAIEVAVHGWDVARACGRDRPVPPALAAELLELAPMFVSDEDRPGRFAAPVDVPPRAGPADRLIAFLGRAPS